MCPHEVYGRYVTPFQGFPFRGTSCSQGFAQGCILAAPSALLSRSWSTCRTNKGFLERSLRENDQSRRPEVTRAERAIDRGRFGVSYATSRWPVGWLVTMQRPVHAPDLHRS